jgi:molybdopterin adenylyltransferase
LRVAVITISDRASKGVYEDRSGKLIIREIEKAGWKVESYRVIPDDYDEIRDEIVRVCDDLKVDLVLTTGGTGLAKRDVTPEATMAVIDRRVYGIEIAMICNSLKYTPNAVLSRAIVGIRGKTLIINLPGSEKAVEEHLSFLMQVIPHAVENINS